MRGDIFSVVKLMYDELKKDVAHKNLTLHKYTQHIDTGAFINKHISTISASEMINVKLFYRVDFRNSNFMDLLTDAYLEHGPRSLYDRPLFHDCNFENLDLRDDEPDESDDDTDEPQEYTGYNSLPIIGVFSNCNMKGMNFENAFLKVRIFNSNMQRTNFNNTFLNNSTFSNVNLKNTTITDSTHKFKDFTNCNFSGLNFDS